MKKTKLIAAVLALSVPTFAAAEVTNADGTTTKDSAATQLNDAALATMLASGVNTDVPDHRPGTDVQVPAVNQHAGGIIAGENTNVKSTSKNTVILRDNAQQNVNTVNLVNNSGAMTDNATNIWDGNFKAKTTSDLVPLSINNDFLGEQDNVIMQTSGNSAFVAGYNEYEADMNHKSSSTLSSTDSANASVTAGHDSSSILDGFLFEGDESIGRGIAASAGADIHVDAGEVTVGGGITTGGSVAWGLLSGETTMEAEVTVELPELDVEFDGTACAAFEGASCAAGHDSSESGSSSEEDTLASVPVETISNAQASIIAKDGANINTSEKNLVDLADNAQQNVNAVNVINAAGGMVGNGLNISHTSGLSLVAGTVGTIRQSNVLIQSR